jgi:hypothetical protein
VGRRAARTNLIDRVVNSSENNVVAAEGASMANDGHVAMLKKGVAAWNKCRHKNPL